MPILILLFIYYYYYYYYYFFYNADEITTKAITGMWNPFTCNYKYGRLFLGIMCHKLLWLY